MDDDEMKHKHYELIVAWAEGKTIQFKYDDHDYDDEWFDCHRTPEWADNIEYRVKPEPNPDQVVYVSVKKTQYSFAEYYQSSIRCDFDNLKLTFDGETNKLKAAEMLK